MIRRIRGFLRSTPVELAQRRWFAYLIDALTVGVVGALFRLLASAPDLIVEMALAVAIESVVLARFDSWTVGRHLFHLRIVRDTPGTWPIAVRAVGRWVPLYATGLAVDAELSLAVGQLVSLAAFAWLASIPLTRGRGSVHDWLARSHVEWTRAPAHT